MIEPIRWGFPMWLVYLLQPYKVSILAHDEEQKYLLALVLAERRRTPLTITKTTKSVNHLFLPRKLRKHLYITDSLLQLAPPCFKTEDSSLLRLFSLF